MRRMLSVAAVLAAGLLVPSTADAAIPRCSAFAGLLRRAGLRPALLRRRRGRRAHRELGQRADRRLGRVPARARRGPDGPYPVIGIYHGWGGSKLSLSGADAQRALTRGYAVFTMTDRGWGQSCGQRRRAPTLAARAATSG